MENALALKVRTQFDLTVRENNFRLETSKGDETLQIVRGCLKGKRRAQEKLYKRFYGYAMSIALRYAKNTDEAAEILNDSFLKAFNKLQTYQQDKPFKAWLRRIVVNTSIDYYRSNKKFSADVELNEAYGMAAEQDVIDSLTAEEILQLLQHLPPQQRVIFNLFEIEGYPHKEISDILEIPEGTCRSALTRARARLKQMVIKLYKEKYEGSF